MASRFNLTAEINLQGPSNVRTIVADIRRQLGSISVDINPQLNANAARNINRLTGDLRNLNSALDATVTSSRNATRAINDLGAAINSIGGRNIQQNIVATSAATQNLTRNMTSVARDTQRASTQMEEFGRQSALAIRRFAAFSIVTSAVYSFINALSKGVDEFISFDKEFVRLQQVTGESAKQLQQLSSEITKLSTQYGVASSSLTNVAVTLAQAGINANDTKKALEALAQSALSPSFDDMNQTVEGSIALMRQFGISATDLGKALGSVSAVSAQFAVEASDIITAIQRTGGVFATASKGVSEGADALNEFIAVFTSVRQTTRESAETIATGLRTIFTRIQRGTTIDALKEFGISLTDLEGKFVGPYEAIKRLSAGLKDLDPRDLKFSGIVEELGGFRQIGKVIPLIQQFAVAQQALKVAQQGQDILAKDAATAQLSLANQIAKVREEFIALVRSIGESDSFRSFVSLSLQLASALIKVADAAKEVLPAIAAIATMKGVSALLQFGSGFSRGLTRPRGFATGGLVPGSGNRDTVPAMLTPGEFVIRKKAVQSIGANRLHGINKYANGGIVQKFAQTVYKPEGGRVKPQKQTLDRTSQGYKRQVNKAIKNKGGVENIDHFGLIALKSGLKDETSVPQIFTQPHITPISKTPVKISIGLLSKQNSGMVTDVENTLRRGYTAGVKRTAKTLASSINADSLPDNTEIQKIIDNAGFHNVVGAGLEAAIGMVGAPFFEKTEATKSIDFPQGIGKASGLFGNFPPNIPTDATRTAGGFGKGITTLLSQAERYITAREEGLYGPKGSKGISENLRTQLDSILTPDKAMSASEITGLTITSKQLKTKNQRMSTLKRIGDNIDEETALRLINTLKYKPMGSPGSIPIRRAAFGGSISGADTVPALLTPGEFVINKKAASRLGSSRLNALNRADKVQGYNRGGFVGGVQKLAKGTAVRPLGPGEYVRSGSIYDIRSDIDSDLLAKKEDQIRARARERQLKRYQIAEQTPQGQSLKQEVIQEANNRIQRIQNKYGTNISNIDERILRIKQAALQQLGVTLTDQQAQTQITAMAKKADKEIAQAKKTAAMQYKQGLKGIVNQDIGGISSPYSYDTTFKKQKTYYKDQADLRDRPNLLQRTYQGASKLWKVTTQATSNLYDLSKSGLKTGASTIGLGGYFGNGAGAGLGSGSTNMRQQARNLRMQGLRGNDLRQAMRGMGGGMGGGMSGMLPFILPTVGGLAVDAASKRYGGETTDMGRNISSIGNSVINYGATGAMVGSMLGPWGTAVGAATGAIYGLVEGMKQAKEAATDYAEKVQRSNVERIVSDNAQNISMYSGGSAKNRAAALKSYNEISAAEATQSIVRSKTDTNATLAQRLASSQQAGASAAQQILAGEMARTGKTFAELRSSMDPALLKSLMNDIVQGNESYQLKALEYDKEIEELSGNAPDIAKKEKEKNAALAALAKQLMIRATAEGTAAVEALRTAKAQENLQKAVDRVMQTYSTSLQTFDQILNSSSTTLDIISQRLDKIARGGSGFNSNESLDQNINVLKNPKAFSAEQKNAAFNSAVSSFPGMEETFKKIADYGPNTEKLLREQLASIRSSNPSELKDQQIDVIRKTAEKQIDDVFKGDESLKRAVREILKTAEKSTTGDEQLDTEEIIKKIVAATGGELGSEVTDKLIKSQQFLIDAFNKLTAQAQTIANINQNIIDRNASFAGQMASNRISWTEALGLKVSNEDKLNARLTETKSRLGFADNINLTPEMIGGRRQQLVQQRSSLENQIAEEKKGNKDANRIKDLELALANVNSAISATTEELGKFGNALQSSIGDVLQQVQDRVKILDQAQGARYDQLIGQITSTPEQRQFQANISNLLEKALAGNYNVNTSPAANRAFNQSMAPMRQEMALYNSIGAQYSPYAIQAMNAQTMESQKAAQEAFAQEIEQILRRFDENITRGGRDPNSQMVRNERATLLQNLGNAQGVDPGLLRQVVEEVRANQAEKEAALNRDNIIKDLATQAKGLADQQGRTIDQLNAIEAQNRQAIIDNVVTPTITAVQDNTTKLSTEIQNLAAAIANLAQQGGGGKPSGGAPAAAAPVSADTQHYKGGLIYASKGMLVNYEPKGTDTIPAMLTKGEYVVNRDSTRKHLPLLEAINRSNGGLVYMSDGGRSSNSMSINEGFDPRLLEHQRLRKKIDQAVEQTSIERQNRYTRQVNTPQREEVYQSPTSIGKSLPELSNLNYDEAIKAGYSHSEAMRANLYTQRGGSRNSIGGSYLGSYGRNFSQFYIPWDYSQREGNDTTGGRLRTAGRTSMAIFGAALTGAGGLSLVGGAGAAGAGAAGAGAAGAGAAGAAGAGAAGAGAAGVGETGAIIGGSQMGSSAAATAAAHALRTGATGVGNGLAVRATPLAARAAAIAERAASAARTARAARAARVPTTFNKRVLQALGAGLGISGGIGWWKRDAILDSLYPSKPSTTTAQGIPDGGFDMSTGGRVEAAPPETPENPKPQLSESQQPLPVVTRSEEAPKPIVAPPGDTSFIDSLQASQKSEAGAQQTQQPQTPQNSNNNGDGFVESDSKPEQSDRLRKAYERASKLAKEQARQARMEEYRKFEKNISLPKSLVQQQALAQQIMNNPEATPAQKEFATNLDTQIGKMLPSTNTFAVARGMRNDESLTREQAQTKLSDAVDRFDAGTARFSKDGRRILQYGLSPATKVWLKYGKLTGKDLEKRIKEEQARRTKIGGSPEALRREEMARQERERQAEQNPEVEKPKDGAKPNQPKQPPEAAPKPEVKPPANQPPANQPNAQGGGGAAAQPNQPNQPDGALFADAFIARIKSAGDIFSLQNYGKLFGEAFVSVVRNSNILPQLSSTTNNTTINSPNITFTLPDAVRNDLTQLTTIKLDVAAINKLNEFKTDFNRIILALNRINIKIPEKIQMVGQHTVLVKIDAEAMEDLIPGIETMIASEVSSEMERIWGQSGGELGSTPSILG